MSFAKIALRSTTGSRPITVAWCCEPRQMKHLCPSVGTPQVAVAIAGSQEERIVRLVMIVLAVILLSWSAAEAQNDAQFPYPDPYLATVTGTALNADGLTPGIKREVIAVPILADRDRLPGLEGRGALNIALYRQKKPAPLLFILPGTGSNPFFGIATYVAGLFHQQGSHVVLLPSPMTWNFALAASRSGAPGYTPDDARDLYDAMQRILALLQDRHDIKITRINLLGMSLGALEAAYVSRLDAQTNRIGIARYLLVDPPLDVSSVLTKLEEWGALREKFGLAKTKELETRALGVVEGARQKQGDAAAVVAELARGFAPLTREEIQFLIAAYMETALPELVTITQAIHDQGVLSAPKGQVRKRLQEARRMTFADYSDKIAGPIWSARSGEPDTKVTAFTERGSLGAILEQLKGNPRVFIVYNTDDFLADRQAIEDLKTAMGTQVKLYPYGGHMGSLWFPPNRDYMLGLFQE